MYDLLKTSNYGQVYRLSSPTQVPLAASFLWNSKMMIQMNCRGYATAQFMQPEPAKYCRGPNIEAQTFMQPEQNYYAHHPGRFVYIKDRSTNRLFSVPYEPVRCALDKFEFIVSKDKISWRILNDGLEIKMTLTLACDFVAELWTIKVTNVSQKLKRISIYPYFPVGYMSWMNQSASYDKDLQSIICKSVTPYQKFPDYFKNMHLKDLTYLLAQVKPDAWESCQKKFEGEGGLHNPCGISQSYLSNSDAVYETPTAVLQYTIDLKPAESQSYRFVFGPAQSKKEIEHIKKNIFNVDNGFGNESKKYQHYIAQSDKVIEVGSPDAELNKFVNHWLPRQVFYHGDVNRLSTDPQTRNYLQDAMGMCYIKPLKAREAFIRAVSQQLSSGAMPDGILLNENAELKYINQVPHTDHCVWLPICLQVYLDETSDIELLDQQLVFSDSSERVSLFDHVCRAMQWLINACDERGLNYIDQGDWCDPMNMVGYKGRGVSGWLSLASAYALNQWSNICEQIERIDQARYFRAAATEFNTAVNTFLWDGRWYARGITDDNRIFGINQDNEGKIFLNPQSWAMLSGAADREKINKILEAVDEHLQTPYGVSMLAPAFTEMVEDIGRVTQKFPGTAENGSVYNHAAAFYAYGLYSVGEYNKAYKILQQMLPNGELDDFLQRGQLPVFIPNYYRGAYKQHPSRAGHSSQLFNTGTVHWFYRCVVEGLFGIRGNLQGVCIQPNLPDEWAAASIVRMFRGATLTINITRCSSMSEQELMVNGILAPKGQINMSQKINNYHIDVKIPCCKNSI